MKQVSMEEWADYCVKYNYYLTQKSDKELLVCLYNEIKHPDVVDLILGKVDYTDPENKKYYIRDDADNK